MVSINFLIFSTVDKTTTEITNYHKAMESMSAMNNVTIIINTCVISDYESCIMKNTRPHEFNTLNDGFYFSLFVRSIKYRVYVYRRVFTVH